MFEFLFWIYLINFVLLTVHEIDSAYWKEWEMFHLPGGLQGFLLMHIPLLLILAFGLVLVYEKTLAGLVLSLILSIAGIFAFFIHMYFIRKGRDEFTLPVSIGILIATLIVSLFQIVLTLMLLTSG